MSPSRISEEPDTAAPPSKTAGTIKPSSASTRSFSSTGSRFFGMNTSMVESKFLSHPEELGIVAVGFSGGQCKPGVDAAPSALIESGLLTQLREELGYKLYGDDQVHLYTDLVPKDDPPHRNMKNPRAVSSVTRRIADQVYSHAKEGRLVLTLGGDHSIAIGTIGGTAKAIRETVGQDIAVIWVDAHADINTPETSGSGNIHGMPVSFLTGLAREDNEDFFGWLKPENRISVKKLVYIGLRDVDAGEKRILRENGIKAFSMFDIDRHGIGRVMEMALGHIGTDTPIHLSFDVDALDPMWAPSTGTPVRGGLTLREGDYICECVHETGSLVAVDLVEVNPSLAPESDIGAHETVRAGCSLRPFSVDREHTHTISSVCGSPQPSSQEVTSSAFEPDRRVLSNPLIRNTMASSTVTSGSLVYERRIVSERVHKYHWPAVQLNIWMLIMLVAACTIIGVFSTFIQIQQTLLLGVPWYFPYYITVGALTVTFIILLLWLIFQRRLLPSIVMIGGFILFVLWLVGLIVISVQLWGPSGSVSSNCNLVVFGANPQPTGQSEHTLAWLQQRSICQSWQAVFAFGVVGAIFLLWIMVIAYQVFADDS
ncbi:arginase-like protein [Apodospora peruviana]|uniref:Arginase n=1 Tax=Apodospora peruviana TaxID=516989 RepID=A0AAE0HW09_9PEZI|nr:arginase-like protein [Apodospora peruviana]